MRTVLASDSPNVLGAVGVRDPGIIRSVSPTAPQSFLNDGVVTVGATWDENDLQWGNGHIALIMDRDWLSFSTHQGVIENLLVFLQNRAT